MQRLDQAFPEFGWRRDARGWVATNQEHTHARLGVRADRVVAHEPQRLPRPRRRADALDRLRQRRHRPARRRLRPRRRESSPSAPASTLRRSIALSRATGAPSCSRASSSSPARARRRTRRARARLPRAAAASRSTRSKAQASGSFRPAEAHAQTLAPRRLSRRGDQSRRHPRRHTLAREALRRLARRVGEDRHVLGASRRRARRAEQRYLYLRGASRTNLPPYGSPARTREQLVLVEGFLDYHQLPRAGSRTSPRSAAPRPARAIRAAQPARRRRPSCSASTTTTPAAAATARAVENAARARTAPRSTSSIPTGSAAKDPDELVRAWRHGGVARAARTAANAASPGAQRRSSGDVAP